MFPCTHDRSNRSEPCVAWTPAPSAATPPVITTLRNCTLKAVVSLPTIVNTRPLPSASMVANPVGSGPRNVTGAVMSGNGELNVYVAALSQIESIPDPAAHSSTAVSVLAATIASRNVQFPSAATTSTVDVTPMVTACTTDGVACVATRADKHSAPPAAARPKFLMGATRHR